MRTKSESWRKIKSRRSKISADWPSSVEELAMFWLTKANWLVKVLTCLVVLSSAWLVSVPTKPNWPDNSAKRELTPSELLKKELRKTDDAGSADKALAAPKKSSSAELKPTLLSPMMSITRLLYSTMGFWLDKSLVLLRKFDSANASNWRLTACSATPVPKNILAALLGDVSFNTTSWRE